MDNETFSDLIEKYREKADYHGFEALLGDKDFRGWHRKEEKKYDRMIIELCKLYLEEYEPKN